ncbi:MAG: hypothetical protein AB1295_06460 [Candidatus Micrarchaeota archaeon]
MDRVKWTLQVNSLLFLAFLAAMVSGFVMLLDLAGLTGIGRGPGQTSMSNPRLRSRPWWALISGHLWIYKTWIMAMPKMMER